MGNVYKNIEALCKEDGIKIGTLCSELGISRGTLGDLKAGRTKQLSRDILAKIACYFDVPEYKLAGDTPLDYCRKCGCQYNITEQEEGIRHDHRHAAWEKAVQTFGFCWTYIHRERMKANARGRMEAEPLSEDEYINEQLTVFKALFSRSLEASHYHLAHVDFPTYVAMSLAQNQWKKKLPSHIYEKMVAVYGTQPGMPQGTYYLVSSDPESFFSSYDANMKDEIQKMNFHISDTDPQIEELHTYTDQLNAQGLERLNRYAEDLTQIPLYQKKTTSSGR